MFHVKHFEQILCIQHKFPFIWKQDLLRKNYMKEIMVCVNWNQVVDGHEHRTSTFIIKISDRINFVINNGWGPYLFVLIFARQSYGHIMIMNSLFLFILDNYVMSIYKH
jgi:hypothetical protein